MEAWSVEFATNYDKMKIFGYPACFHVQEDKLDPRSKKAIFVGFSTGVKAYRLWWPKTKKIVNNCDVTFHDSMMLKNSEQQNLSSSILQQVELQSFVSPSKIVLTVEILEEESTDGEEVPTQEISLQPVGHNEWPFPTWRAFPASTI